MKTPALLMALVAVATATGCGGLFVSHEATPAVYQLDAGAVASAPVRVPAVLIVSRPRPRPGLESERIAVALADRRLDVYAGSRWSAPLPLLVEALLIEGLRSSGGWEAVVSEHGEFAGRYLLATDIRAFEADYSSGGAAPTVRVRLLGELGLVGERRLVASVEGNAAVIAAADREREVTAAFEAAYRQAAGQLIAAVNGAAAAAEAAKPVAAAPRPK